MYQGSKATTAGISGIHLDSVQSESHQGKAPVTIIIAGGAHVAI